MAINKLRGELLVDCTDDDDNVSHGFEVTWSNVYYHVYPTRIERLINKVQGHRRLPVVKTILNNCSGTIKSGRLTAIMGPSGSGKSTFLKCLAGLQVSGLEGDLRLIGTISKITVAYLPQEDQLVAYLTVRELITYAYQLKSGESRSMSMDKYVNTLIGQLGLTVCADLTISQISGGQKKRTSIAQELTNSPDILLLDEPTSGLDSSSCYQLIELLESIVQKSSVAIVISIHQPSAHAFSALQDVYMLSKDGRIMFNGSPDKVVDTLSSVGIKVGTFNNPADILTEVAFGAYGMDPMNKMVQLVEERSIREHQPAEFVSTVNRKMTDKPLHDCISFESGSSITNLLTLTKRHFTFNKRDVFGMSVRATFAVNVVVLLATFFPNVGQFDGCLPETVEGDLKRGRLDAVHVAIEEHLLSTRDNLCCFYFSLIFVILVNLMPMATRIPLFMDIFLKEYSNGWYSISNYFISHFVAELPFSMFISSVGFMGQFLFTSQPIDRFFSTCVIYTFISLISQLHGLLVGIVLIRNLLGSVFTAPNSAIPLLLLSGFFVRVNNMPFIYQNLSVFSYVRYGFEGTVASVFGFQRCTGQAKSIEIFNESKGQLSSFMHSMFKIARNNIDQLISPEEAQLLGNQTITLTDSIVKSLDGPYFGRGLESGIMSYFNLTDDSYYSAIWRLMLITIFELLLVCWLSKLIIGRRQ